MRKYSWILCCLCVLPVWGNVVSCEVKKEVPLQLMGKELTRNFKLLKKQKPPVYYLAYTYQTQEAGSVRASFDGVDVQQKEERFGDVSARVGSLAQDNTRALKGERENFELAQTGHIPFPSLEDTTAFERTWWNLTEQAVRQAQKQYSRVLSHSHTMTQTKDPSDDFVFPPKEIF